MTFSFRNKPLFVAVLLTGALATSAMAQRQATPEERQERRERGRERFEQMTPEQRAQRWQERLKNMTPEQRTRFEARQAEMQAMQRQQQLAQVSGEDRQKYLMKSAGIEDATTQDAILEFVKAQAEHRKSVTAEGRQLSMLLADANTTPEAFTAQHDKLKTAAKEFRTWKEGALKELDAKVSYTKNPRLYALLALVGIIGDEGNDAGGYNAMFPNGLAGDGDIAALLPPVQNQWGGGGFGGGGRGGRGGNNGDNNNAGNNEGAAPAAAN